MKRILAPLGLLTLFACSDTGAYLAPNGLLVNPTSPTTFDIPFRGKSADQEFWCAAGDYTVRSAGLSPTTRIYRTSAPPRRSGEGVSFSYSSENATDPGIILIGGDGGVSAATAQTFCSRNRPRFDD